MMSWASRVLSDAGPRELQLTCRMFMNDSLVKEWGQLALTLQAR
jgi:hypothetical protein